MSEEERVGGSGATREEEPKRPTASGRGAPRRMLRWTSLASSLPRSRAPALPRRLTAPYGTPSVVGYVEHMGWLGSRDAQGSPAVTPRVGVW